MEDLKCIISLYIRQEDTKEGESEWVDGWAAGWKSQHVDLPGIRTKLGNSPVHRSAIPTAMPGATDDPQNGVGTLAKTDLLVAL